jgi:pilus assembly protein CpaB
LAIDDMMNPRRRNEGARRSGGRALMFWLVALVAGGSAAMLLRWYIENSATPNAPALAKVAVAAVDLPVATTLRAEHIRLVDWPENVQPPGALRDVRALTGRVLVTKVSQGEPLLAGKLASKDAGRGLAALIPEGMRAVAVRVDEVVGVAGFVHPDDRVDVIATVKAENEVVAKVILQNVKVLAVGKELEVEEKSRSQATPATVATLLVTPQESEKLALSSVNSRLLLSLRSWTDSASVDTPGASSYSLLTGVEAGRTRPVAATPPVIEAVRRMRHGRPDRPAGTPVAASPQKEVVEILRGDRLEERKFDSKEKP